MAGLHDNIINLLEEKKNRLIRIHILHTTKITTHNIDI